MTTSGTVLKPIFSQNTKEINRVIVITVVKEVKNIKKIIVNETYMGNCTLLLWLFPLTVELKH